MVVALGLSYIWLAGLHDYVQTRVLLASVGLHAELNPIARGLAQTFGCESLLLYKGLALLFFSAVVLVAARHRRELALQATGAAVFAHVLLIGWWQVVRTVEVI